jgi:MFS family permease
LQRDVTTQSEIPTPSQTPKAFYWHYAWAIVTIIAVMQMVGASIRMAFGVFIEPLTVEFGWGQGSITFAYALSSIVTALVSPFAGSLGDRFGARKAMMLGTAMFFVGMILTGMVTEIWHLYLTFGVLLGVAQAVFLVPLIPAAMLWFRRNLGLGMGVLMAAWGVGPALAAPLMGYLIERFGWQDTFWITAFGSVVIMFAMVVMFRDRPSDRGDLPYGALPEDPPQVKASLDVEKVKLFTRFMRNTAAYWNMSSIHFLGCVGHAVILVYIIPIAISEGVSVVVAASLLTVMSGVSVITRLAVPVMAERMGTRTVMAVAYVAQGLPVIMLFWTHDVTMFYVFAIVFGIGYGGEAGGFPILNRKYYGLAPVGAAHGFQMLGAGLGMAVGGWVGGITFDLTGGYDIALVVSIVTSLGGAVSIMLLEPTHEPLIPDWEATTPALDGQPESVAR